MIGYPGEDLWHWVDSGLEGLLADGQHLDAVGGEVAAEEDVHQVDLKPPTPDFSQVFNFPTELRYQMEQRVFWICKVLPQDGES